MSTRKSVVNIIILISVVEAALLAWIIKDPITMFVFSGKTFAGRSLPLQFAIFFCIFCACVFFLYFFYLKFEKSGDKFENVIGKFRHFSINENVILLSLAMFGIILRVRQYLFTRSLWFDELSLASNFINHDLLYLIANPLDTRQSAPLGFIFFTKAIGKIFNYSDLSLRLFPFLIGMGVVLLSIIVANRILSPVSRFVFVWLISTSPVLIYYSNEVKPYIADAFFYLLLLIIYILYREKKINIYWVSFIGLLAILFSFTSAMILCIVGLIEFFIAHNEHREWDRNAILFASILWLTVFTIIYLGFNRKNSPMDYYISYWGNRFAPFSISIKSLNWYWKAMLEFANLGFHPYSPVGVNFYSGQFEVLSIVLIVITFIGIIFQFKKQKMVAIFNGGILALALLISALKLFPFGARLNLYLIPIAFGLICTCLENLVSHSSYSMKFFGYQLILATLAVNTIPSINAFFNPIDNADIKNALLYLQAHAVSTDSLTMVDNTYPAYGFYSKYYDLPDFSHISAFSRPFNVDNYLNDVCENQPDNHVWILITQLFYEGKEFIVELSEKGTLLEKWESSGSGLYYFQFDLNSICPEK